MSNDYSCKDCGHEFDVPKNVDRLEYRCPNCNSKQWRLTPQRASAIWSAKDNCWELENNGRGRYIGGLGKRGDPQAYCRSLSEAKERAKRTNRQYEIG